jgi:hypothetical protein
VGLGKTLAARGKILAAPGKILAAQEKMLAAQGKTLVAAGKILDLLKTIQMRLFNQLKQLKPSFGFLFQLQFYFYLMVGTRVHCTHEGAM